MTPGHADGRALTEPAVRRLAQLLVLIPSRHAGGTPVVGMAAFALPLLGGPRTAVDDAADRLERLGLVGAAAGRMSRTDDGDRVARALKSGRAEPLALALIRSGWFAQQIDGLLALLEPQPDGYRCSGAAARRTAPQLVAVLSSLPGVRAAGTLTVPLAVAAELQAPWCQWELPPMAVPGSAEHRQQIGDRAELYTVNLERLAYPGAFKHVLWVSRDDYTAGYDVEAAAPSGRRCVEVKGSQNAELSFVLSANELAAARRLGPKYEIHFWGGVRLADAPAADYRRLRDAGFPIVINDPASAFDRGEYALIPTGYRVRRAGAEA